MDFAAVNRQIGELERRIGEPAELSPGEQLFVGVDLGTAYIVVVVVNAERKPVACALEFAQVVRDGLVVDYTGATRIVRKLVQQLGERLGRELELAAIAVPPGTGERECATHRHVVEGAGLMVTSVLDEPTAANAVLGVENGVIVDIGGGTTGLSVLENGKVVYVADEPTGGTHLSLVLAGNYGISFEEAENIKKDPGPPGGDFSRSQAGAGKDGLDHQPAYPRARRFSHISGGGHLLSEGNGSGHRQGNGQAGVQALQPFSGHAAGHRAQLRREGLNGISG